MALRILDGEWRLPTFGKPAYGKDYEMLTPLLHKDVVESTARPHQKAVSAFLRITFKGHSWIDPGDDIDLTAIPLWVRV
jgi:hypothetical protein